MSAVGLRHDPQRRVPGFALAAGEGAGLCQPEAYA